MDLYPLARNPIPIEPVCGQFAGDDGVRLRFARWHATRTPHRGTVVLFQGRGEFIEKYFEVVADLRRRGFAVATHDWRGQGGSQRLLANPRKGHIGDFSEYDRDITQFMQDVVLPECPPPYVALAHSMGGHILLRRAALADCRFERMVLSAPMLALADDKIPVPQGLARAYATVFGACGGSGWYVPGGNDAPAEAGPFEGNALTSDRERFTRNRQVLEACPSLGLGSPTVGWLGAAYRSSRTLMAPGFAMRVRVPILLVAAGADRIVATPAIEKFASSLKIGAHILIASSRHEILQERDEIRARFWAAFDAYLGVNEAVA